MCYLAERAIVASMMKGCCVEMKERWKVSLIWVVSCVVCGVLCVECCVGVERIVWRVFGTNRGKIVGLVEMALKSSDIYS